MTDRQSASFLATIIADLIHRSVGKSDYRETRSWVEQELLDETDETRDPIVQEALDDIRMAAKYAALID